MRLVWSDEAIESVDKTGDYIEANFGTARYLNLHKIAHARVRTIINNR